MKRRARSRLSSWILAMGIAVTGAACGLVAGLDKLEFSDECQSTCNDQNDCTENDCLVSNACQGRQRPMGTLCSTDGGLLGACIGTQCVLSCSSPSDCDDHNPCTTDTCASTKTCAHEEVSDGPLAPDASDDPGPCKTYRCMSGMLQVVPTYADEKDPTSCTWYRCDAGVPSLQIEPYGTVCGEAGTHQICDDAGTCGCTNDGQCEWPSRCESGSCKCGASTCADLNITCGQFGFCNLSCDGHAKNGNETDVDCGGLRHDPMSSQMPPPQTCERRCGLGKSCVDSSDCSAGVCFNKLCCKQKCPTANWTCNGNGVCQGLPGANCGADHQCKSGNCVNGTCK